MRVAILVVPGVQLLDLAGPMDVFSEANVKLGYKAYELEVIALTMDPVVAQNGIRFMPDRSIDQDPTGIDTLLAAGSVGIQEIEEQPALQAWLKKASESVRRLGSICTAAFLLAHAGVLNGRRATTHWNSTKRLADTFPQITVDPNKIYIKDGPIYTSGGVTASMDLALALVEEDHGRSVALAVAKQLILFLKRPGGQSQFSMHLEAQVSEMGPVREIQTHVLDNLAADLSMDALSARVGMSGRNFARIFKRETGVTPGDYVEIARVEAARRMLEEGDTPLKKIASKCGFGDQSSLRRAFMRQVRVTPVEYRQRFRPAEPVVVEFAATNRPRPAARSRKHG